MAKATTKRTTTTTSRSPVAHYDLRKNLSSIGLWALGLLNAVLIFSFISKHFLTGDERLLNASEEIGDAVPSVMKIEVLNGCGVQGIAKKWADHLRTAGFDPVNVTNYDSNNIPRTIIYDRESNACKNGLEIAKSLGLPKEYVAYQQSDQRMVAVTVIIGQDHDQFEIAQK
jgi:hypothetical protein